MTNISYNLIGRLDRDIVNLLSSIDEMAEGLGIAFFVVGATARDILLQHAHDIRSTRATVDIDIGVSVTGPIFTIVDKRKRIIELDEPPARGLFLWTKKRGDGWQTGAPQKTGSYNRPQQRVIR